MAKKKGRKKTARRGRVSLAGVSLAQLQAELDKRASEIDALHAERGQLVARLAEIDAALGTGSPTKTGRAAAGGTAKRGRGRPKGSKNVVKKKKTTRKSTGKRPSNKMNLADSMGKVLKGKTMGVSELADAVQKAGYKTTAANFRTIVNQTLIRDDRFKKVSRGQYTVK